MRLAVLAGIDHKNGLRTGERLSVQVAVDLADAAGVPLPDQPRVLAPGEKLTIAYKWMVITERRVRRIAGLAPTPSRWVAQRAVLVLHSGYLGNDDLATKIVEQADVEAISIVVIRIDMVVDPARNILSPALFCGLFELLLA